MDALPLDPTGGWKWKVNRQRGADRQYRVVAGLLSRTRRRPGQRVRPDREGESIFHRIVSYAGTRKPMLRLWSRPWKSNTRRGDLMRARTSTGDWRGRRYPREGRLADRHERLTSGHARLPQAHVRGRV